MSQVEFYFDFSCPWSYLALLRLQDVCERNRAELMLKPVSVERILATENPALVANRFDANPAKAAWQRKDLRDWAAFWGLKIQLGEHWPENREPAAAAALAAIETGDGLAFCLTMFRTAFGEGEDINKPAVLAWVCSQLGLDTGAIANAAEQSERIAQVHRNSLELIERGGFGTPSMFVDNGLFYGNDRVPLVEWTLGPMSDAEFVMPGQHEVY